MLGVYVWFILCLSSCRASRSRGGNWGVTVLILTFRNFEDEIFVGVESCNAPNFGPLYCHELYSYKDFLEWQYNGVLSIDGWVIHFAIYWFWRLLFWSPVVEVMTVLVRSWEYCQPVDRSLRKSDRSLGWIDLFRIRSIGSRSIPLGADRSTFSIDQFGTRSIPCLILSRIFSYGKWIFFGSIPWDQIDCL